MRRVGEYVAALREQRHPARFVFARLLAKTGLNRRLVMSFPGFRMRFHPTAMSSALWVDPAYRQADTDFLDAYLRAGDTVVDAGANVGFLSLWSAMRVGKSGMVRTIEAHPRTASFTALNFAMNDVPQVTLHNVALGAEEGEIVFSDSGLDDQNHVTEDGAGVRVPVRPLASLLADVAGDIHLLKIDVEGYEAEVLKGARPLLPRVRCIYMESWEEHFVRYHTSSAEVRDLLREAGFVVYRIEGRRLIEVPDGYASLACENLVATADAEWLRGRLAGAYTIESTVSSQVSITRSQV